ncbi:hypothetical protein H2248_003123 [Termitomyces sp. 'cryptogamus']|nr:hypothetical protein H2248_003123 [Termitomyces sp. 'cryptogamus']
MELVGHTMENAVELQMCAVKPKNKKRKLQEEHLRHDLKRNATKVNNPERMVHEPIVVVVHINGSPVRALLDLGSLGDFVSTTIVNQLNLKKTELDTPLNVQMAAKGSRSQINYDAVYQSINEERRFDVMNLSRYNAILGTPWFYQHQVMIGFNPTHVVIGSNTSLPLAGMEVNQLASRAMQLEQERFDFVRENLQEYAKPACQKAAESPLPPLRAINHEIPLVDESKEYSWHPSKCPEALLPQWVAKKEAYIKTGRWEVTSGRSSAPMLCIPKPSSGDPPKLRMVVDLREQNANTKKMSSPLPDMEGILRRAARANF